MNAANGGRQAVQAVGACQKLAILVATVAAILAAGRAKAEQERDFSIYSFGFDDSYHLSLAPLMSEQPITRARLLENQSLFQNYSEFLSYIKTLGPEMFQQPILLHHSGSLQAATFEQPRVLLFGRGVMLSFSEQPGQVEKSVEMLEYDPASAKFLATEIKFSGSGKPQITKDPSSCTACHGEPLRPIWSPYDFWPKAYNSFTAGVASEEEEQKLNSFLQGERLGIYSMIEMHAGSFGNVRDNEAFTQYLFGLNTHRMMKQWSREPSLLPFRYAIAATLNHCTTEAEFGGKEYIPFEEFFPPRIWAKLSAVVSPVDYVERTDFERRRFLRFVNRSYLRKFVRLDRDLDISTRLDFFGPPTAHTRFLLEQLGMQWRTWTMSYGENDFDMSIPGNVLVDLGTALSVFDRDMFLEQQPEVKFLTGAAKPIPYAQLSCRELQTSSLDELNRFQEMEFSEPLIDDHFDGLAPMSKCVKCHSANSRFDFEAPKIPFEDSTLLSVWLNDGTNFETAVKMIASGKMPEDSRLTELEKQALIESLEFIKQN
jgi:hypothetical protein